MKEWEFACLNSGSSQNNRKQAGTVLGQAQLKLELELLYFTSLKMCRIKLIQLVILCLLGGATLLILQNLTWNDWDMAETIIVSNSISERLTGGYLGSYLDCINGWDSGDLVKSYQFSGPA